jgi:hypothetical protein
MVEYTVKKSLQESLDHKPLSYRETSKYNDND